MSSVLTSGLLGLVVAAGAPGGGQAGQSQGWPVDLAKFAAYGPGLGDGDYTVGPTYQPAPELTPRTDVPHGKVYEFVMHSTDSLRYPGISRNTTPKIIPYDRHVHVYIPAQYLQGTPAPFMVSQDSMGRNHLPTILDNMIADHRVPALIAIMIDSGGSDSFGSERGLEYDTMSGGYALFIETEVLPKISHDYNVTFTKNPDGRLTMGGSSGGACALEMAWYHPEWYHRILTYSGTYVNQQWPPNPESPHGAWEFHEHLFPQSRRMPFRIWMEVGAHDLRYNDEAATLHNWVMANQRMAAVLRAKHYHYQYVYAQEAGHVDGRAVDQTLPSALEYVWRGYR